MIIPFPSKDSMDPVAYRRLRYRYKKLLKAYHALRDERFGPRHDEKSTALFMQIVKIDTAIKETLEPLQKAELMTRGFQKTPPRGGGQAS